MIGLARRMLMEPDKRLLWKFAWNMGYKGIRSVQAFKRRLAKGEHFPPFLFISITSGCQLRCQGCWVDVAAPVKQLSLDEINGIINEAKAHGNSFFGLLGGEPLLHPNIIDVLAAHPDCYFQIFTNGHLIDERMAKELRRVGNATPLISVEGDEIVSDVRRGRSDVLSKTMLGIDACRRQRLITGVASSVCQSNIDALVNDVWLRRLIDLKVHYAWFHTYRVVGPEPNPELALSPEQVVDIRRYVVKARSRLPIAIVDAYWDHDGQALCPMATGVSHHISPYGDVEPCPIIQFATESIRDGSGDLYELLNGSEFLRDFRDVSAKATRGCVVLERPDLVKELVTKHSARDTTQRATAFAEMEALVPRGSQHVPGQEVPEENWAYRFAKRNWFFGFGAYT